MHCTYTTHVAYCTISMFPWVLHWNTQESMLTVIFSPHELKLLNGCVILREGISHLKSYHKAAFLNRAPGVQAYTLLALFVKASIDITALIVRDFNKPLTLWIILSTFISLHFCHRYEWIPQNMQLFWEEVDYLFSYYIIYMYYTLSVSLYT